jgi:hypothetical protein
MTRRWKAGKGGARLCMPDTTTRRIENTFPLLALSRIRMSRRASIGSASHIEASWSARLAVGAVCNFDRGGGTRGACIMMSVRLIGSDRRRLTAAGLDRSKVLSGLSSFGLVVVVVGVGALRMVDTLVIRASFAFRTSSSAIGPITRTCSLCSRGMPRGARRSISRSCLVIGSIVKSGAPVKQ